MKKFATILGIILLGALLAVPAFVWANGRGWGGGMMSNWGSGAGYGCWADRDDEGVTGEQQEKLSALNKKFYDETKDLRTKLWSKSEELDTLLEKASPDMDKVKTVQKEISELRGALDEKDVTRELEARKIAPAGRTQEEYRSGGFGRGFGRHMDGRGYGRGYGRHMGGNGAYGMGYGPGGCAN